MNALRLMNYPDQDEEFNEWFREQEPEQASEIDAQIKLEQEIASVLSLALKYLEHPDVSSMPFALPSTSVALRIRTALKSMGYKEPPL